MFCRTVPAGWFEHVAGGGIDEAMDETPSPSRVKTRTRFFRRSTSKLNRASPGERNIRR
jgi:hypothetical protein